MLNAEKYKNEILENSNAVFDFSMSKDKHTIKKCLGVCDNCIFCNMGEHCSNVKVKWLLAEYKGPPVKVSKLEYDILKWIKENTQFEYIVRNEIGHLFASSGKPSKQQYVWTYRERTHELSIFDKLFKFVKCEDEKPTLIQSILENCGVVDDD